MQLYTQMPPIKADWSISYTDNIFLLGSCFANNIATKLREYFFNCHANPQGVLYNPISVAHHMFSYQAKQADVFIITFGTAWVYVEKAKLKNNELDAVVDNCLKKPQSLFLRKKLSVPEILTTWQPILESYPNKRFIFTVSPIRHIKDGFHENQLSKSILLIALEQLIQDNKEHCQVAYFPAYELMLDELRDYRFYAEDMVHPSSQAMQYIWERFAETYLFDATTKKEMEVLHQLYLDTNHRILHPTSKEADLFRKKTNETIARLAKQYPWIEENLKKQLSNNE